VPSHGPPVSPTAFLNTPRVSREKHENKPENYPVLSRPFGNFADGLESLRYCLVLQMAPIRLVRLLHTILLSIEMHDKDAATAKTEKIDRIFYTLASYIGSDALDLTASLQLGLYKSEQGLVAQLLGNMPGGEDGAHACCLSFANDADMTTVLESIDMSQGMPVGQ
jgi:hypothetical protein